MVDELEARFMEGERLTIEEIVREYFSTTNMIAAYRAQGIVRGWINSLKTRFTRTAGLWFGNLNDQGQFGLCETEAEYRYVITRYYNFAKGVMGRTLQVRNEAVAKGSLKEGLTEERYFLPKLIPTEEPEKSKRKKI